MYGDVNFKLGVLYLSWPTAQLHAWTVSRLKRKQNRRFHDGSQSIVIDLSTLADGVVEYIFCMQNVPGIPGKDFCLKHQRTAAN